MRFKIDENLPVEVLELLRNRGHEALTVVDQQLGGSPDGAIASVCRSEQRILMTLDLDFSDIRTYPPAEYAELVVLRLTRQDKRHVLEVLDAWYPCLPRSRRRVVSGSSRMRVCGFGSELTRRRI